MPDSPTPDITPDSTPATTPAPSLGQRLRAACPEYDLAAYDFVLAAMHEVAIALPERRHITGAEMADGVRRLALEQYGVMALPVLEHWGIRTTLDIGRVVFNLVDHGVISARPEDRVEDFLDLFDFQDAFVVQYPWLAGVR